jgi:hypothetical protein
VYIQVTRERLKRLYIQLDDCIYNPGMTKKLISVRLSEEDLTALDGFGSNRTETIEHWIHSESRASAIPTASESFDESERVKTLLAQAIVALALEAELVDEIRELKRRLRASSVSGLPVESRELLLTQFRRR